MFIKLFLLFTLVPLFELWLLIRVGEVVGALNTIALVLITGAVGAALARQQGVRTLIEFQAASKRGEVPTDQIIDGLLILVGGILLITPGITTDLVGFALVLPFTRKTLRSIIKHSVENRIVVMGASPPGAGSFYQQPPGQFGAGPGQSWPPRGTSHKPPANDDDIIDV